MEDDTDILLTLVQSLLEPASSLSQADILEALVQFSGSVEDAAAYLNKQFMTQTATAAGRVNKTTTRKRKRSPNLDAWLKPASKSSATRENDLPKPMEHADWPSSPPL
ncbi:hypothetical protein EST38_g977 [Candolleomyces aberdarensis]|uniref:Uncharacterized protein n=1 Tax=Candolleomyces aberdarensis TaxID=2316362 RepID=A0A4Q2DZC8_9AGAR|nr:hypothetical protein EST38_g977 [Candolleomyces aberdarensis]